LIVLRGDLWRDPLRRVVVIGPPIGIALFVLAAPYGEMRFAYPSVALLFAAGALATRLLPVSVQLAMWGAFALAAAITAFRIELTVALVPVAVMSAAVGVAWFYLRRIAALWVAIPAAAAVAVAIVLLIGMYEYLRLPRGFWNYSWQQQYGPIADAWDIVRNELPPDATIAYASTYFTYPLMGLDYRHRVVYAPTRRDLDDFIHMPRIEEPMTGERITQHITAMLLEHPDREQWLRRLKASGADYLFVGKQQSTIAPPELDFAARDPRMFQKVFENDAAAVFKIAG
jgi:hypothetical protein